MCHISEIADDETFKKKNSTTPTYSKSQSSNPEVRQNLCERVMTNINCNSDFTYSDVSNAVVKAVSNVLPKTRQSTARLNQARNNLKAAAHNEKSK